jgi:hypothetical protein
LSEIQETVLLLLPLGFQEVEMVLIQLLDIRVEEQVELIPMDIFRTINHIKIILISRNKWYFHGAVTQTIN